MNTEIENKTIEMNEEQEKAFQAEVLALIDDDFGVMINFFRYNGNLVYKLDTERIIVEFKALKNYFIF